MKRALLITAAIWVTLLQGMFSQRPLSGEPQHQGVDSSSEARQLDPLGPNAACYVCHITFVKEELSKIHLKAETTCIDCHGLSAAHANDEDVGATPPDVAFKRSQVDASCRECHQQHDVPARQVVARFLERKLSTDVVPICTDCHGTHKIQDAAEGADSAPAPGLAR